MAVMRRRWLTSLTPLWLAPLFGCEAPPPISTEEPCRELVSAAPANWPPRWQAVHSLGPLAVPALIRALRDNPEGAGAQAAIHLLGTFGNPTARPYLETLLTEGTSLSTEAALALGALGATASTPALRAIVEGRGEPVTTRVAAAAALVRLGHAREIVGFLEAVFLAATPDGVKSSRAHGLPRRKTRWAHERYMLIEAIRGRYEGETFGLDEDSSWSRLRKGAAKLAAFLAH
jgi:HEAT repeats